MVRKVLQFMLVSLLIIFNLNVIYAVDLNEIMAKVGSGDSDSSSFIYRDSFGKLSLNNGFWSVFDRDSNGAFYTAYEYISKHQSDIQVGDTQGLPNLVTKSIKVSEDSKVIIRWRAYVKSGEAELFNNRFNNDRYGRGVHIILSDGEDNKLKENIIHITDVLYGDADDYEFSLCNSDSSECKEIHSVYNDWFENELIIDLKNRKINYQLIHLNGISSAEVNIPDGVYSELRDYPYLRIWFSLYLTKIDDFSIEVKRDTIDSGDCSESYQKGYKDGYEAAKKFCKENPSECGIQIREYIPGEYCSTYDFLTSTLKVPCLDLGSSGVYSIDLKIIQTLPNILLKVDSIKKGVH